MSLAYILCSGDCVASRMVSEIENVCSQLGQFTFCPFAGPCCGLKALLHETQLVLWVP